MKTKFDYHKMLAPIVLPFIQHFKEDFLIHDKKILDGYQGEFYYGIRRTGSDIFLIDKSIEQLNILLKQETGTTWTAKGLRGLYYGEIKATDLSYEQYALLCYEGDRNTRFFIGKNGKIREYSKEQFRTLFHKRLLPVQEMIDRLKGSYFVFQEMEREMAIEHSKKMAY